MAESKKAAEVTEATDAPVKKPARSKAAAAKTETVEAPAKAEKAAKAPKAAKAEAAPKAEKPAAAKKPAKAAAEETEENAPGRALRVHHLRPAPGSHQARTRVGRGEGSKGKTAGRGTKGTKARYQVPAGFEGGQMPMHMRLPKLRGFKNPFRTEYQVVNLDRLAELFPKGGAVSVADLVAKGAVRSGRPVKVLGTGDLGSVKIDITVERASASAKEKIEAAGGTVTLA
ncbi:LSU ribosomal protein L15P [Salana multivorans]|uniref:Large ribosomal subunit protein uL15 n=1 Tax=Salana multivorans TaxID=120377 RepID=A0A3N2DD52_9MICO|nr:50S ribosomal protein L15 [Salana multivorans]ROR97364.1 LSU ribosomal protein L15P [Salana multivorans]